MESSYRGRCNINIEFKLTTDFKLIHSVLLHPVIWKLSVGTEEEPPPTYSGLPGLTHVACYYDNNFVGIISYNFLAVRVMHMHLNILPEYWGKIASKVFQQFLNNLKNQITVVKVVAMIPKCCRHTRMFAARHNFKKEGRIAKGVNYADKVQDLLIYSYELRRK